MSTIKIAPSILAADFTRLGQQVSQALDAGAEYIHVDVMDGLFVPNLSIGVPVVESLRRRFPEAFLDVHLMIVRPERYVDAFCGAGASLLSLHVESDEPQGVGRAIEKIKRWGVGAGLALRPGTPADALAPWLDRLDLALVMTVEPGFGGQRFMPDQLDKIRAVRGMIDGRRPDCELEVDGGLGPDTAPRAIQAGANVIVAGSAVFAAPDPAAAIRAMRGDTSDRER